MKKVLMALVLGIVLVGLSGCNGAGEPPIEVSRSVKIGQLGSFITEKPTLKIVALEDSVIIKKIIVNRGNCKIPITFPSSSPYKNYISNYDEAIDKDYMIDLKKAQFNRTLEYGKEWEIVFSSSCDKILEAQIATDKGEWTFKF